MITQENFQTKDPHLPLLRNGPLLSRREGGEDAHPLTPLPHRGRGGAHDQRSWEVRGLAKQCELQIRAGKRPPTRHAGGGPSPGGSITASASRAPANSISAFRKGRSAPGRYRSSRFIARISTASSNMAYTSSALGRSLRRARSLGHTCRWRIGQFTRLNERTKEGRSGFASNAAFRIASASGDASFPYSP